MVDSITGETAEQKAAREAQEAERRRLQAEAGHAELNVAASSSPSILQAIVAFLKFLFSGEFLGLDGSPQHGDGDAPLPAEQPYSQRIALGRMVFSSGALEKWSAYQQQHAGERVTYTSPVEGAAEVTSPFGHREAPMAGASTEHKGVDIGARGSNRSPNILAAADGVVLFAGPCRGYGNAVIIGHADGTQTLYGHLASISVTMGSEIAQSNVIGVMGSEGISTGNHLHFEHRRDGSAVPPEVNGRQLARGDRLENGSAFASLANPKDHPKLYSSDGTPGAPTTLAFNSHRTPVVVARG